MMKTLRFMRLYSNLVHLLRCVATLINKNLAFK